MKVTVNGEPTQLPDGATVQVLVERLGFKGRAVAVEVNKKIVRKKEHAAAVLREGDSVEVVTLVGGG